MMFKTFIRERIKYMILILSLACVLNGILREENRVVLTKAINICLECIGVG